MRISEHKVQLIAASILEGMCEIVSSETYGLEDYERMAILLFISEIVKQQVKNGMKEEDYLNLIEIVNNILKEVTSNEIDGKA